MVLLSLGEYTDKIPRAVLEITGAQELTIDVVYCCSDCVDLLLAQTITYSPMERVEILVMTHKQGGQKNGGDQHGHLRVE